MLIDGSSSLSLFLFDLASNEKIFKFGFVQNNLIKNVFLFQRILLNFGQLKVLSKKSHNNEKFITE